MKVNRRLLTLFAAHSLASGVAWPKSPKNRPSIATPGSRSRSAVDDLLGRMTLEEKVGQMNMPCVYESGLGKTIAEKTEAVQKFAAGTLLERFGPGAASSPYPTRFCTKAPGSRPSF